MSSEISTSTLRGCRVGANPIIWSNDDFPELGGTLSLEECLAEMRAAGYAGSELGHKYPRTADALARVLGAHELQLVSGWHSTYLATRDLAAEETSFKNGWTLYEDGWHVNCLAVHPDWVLSIMMRMPDQLSVAAEGCRAVAASLVVNHRP